jgi:hypothetical protein
VQCLLRAICVWFRLWFSSTVVQCLLRAICVTGAVQQYRIVLRCTRPDAGFALPLAKPSAKGWGRAQQPTPHHLHPILEPSPTPHPRKGNRCLQELNKFARAEEGVLVLKKVFWCFGPCEARVPYLRYTRLLALIK